jgi:very-short-patch-repair endonuclease
VDWAIAAVAQRQHGVVSRTELMELGIRQRAIGHRLECGRLHLLHRGVYAVGHALLSREGRWMAAVLATGPHSVLSHRSAAVLVGIRPSERTLTEVTVPRRRRSRPGIEIHNSAVPLDEVTNVRGIPVTTVPRTLLDLAAVLSRRDLERAIDQAEVLRLWDPLSLADLVARYPGRHGTRNVRAILAAGRIGATVTRSELERRFLSFLEDTGLPRPQVNTLLEVAGSRFEVDCLWRARRLVVELDGHATHATRAAFERDRARDRTLQAGGWRVVRITWRQLCGAPDLVASDLQALLFE